jgi:hypothetical protein
VAKMSEETTSGCLTRKKGERRRAFRWNAVEANGGDLDGNYYFFYHVAFHDLLMYSYRWQ